VYVRIYHWLTTAIAKSIGKELDMVRFDQGERGQGLTEYAFLLSLAVLVVILALFLFGVSVVELYDNFVPRLVDVFT
jgi:hypothetical protein